MTKTNHEPFPVLQSYSFASVAYSTSLGHFIKTQRFGHDMYTLMTSIYILTYSPAYTSGTVGLLRQLPNTHLHPPPSPPSYASQTSQTQHFKHQSRYHSRRPTLLAYSLYVIPMSTQLAQVRNPGSLSPPPPSSPLYIDFHEVLSILPPNSLSKLSSLQEPSSEPHHFLFILLPNLLMGLASSCLFPLPLILHGLQKWPLQNTNQILSHPSLKPFLHSPFPAALRSTRLKNPFLNKTNKCRHKNS